MGKHTRTQTVFDRFDRILIDASSLMNFEALDLFLAENGDGIRNSGRGILMPGSVQMEIARHIDSGKPDKAEKALECIAVLASHPGLVVCSKCDIPEELMYSTHADPEILAMLVSGKRQYRQLLITNDNNLALDALAINGQLSCPGKTVSVKKINRSGDLKSFKPKKQPSARMAIVDRTVPVLPKIDQVPAVQPASSVPDPASVQEIHAAATPAPSESSCPKPAGVPLPLFILGMIGTGILGALFGAVAATSQASEDSELAA